MKKRFLMLMLFVALFVAIFAVSASAAEWTYKDEAGTVYLTLTIDDTTKIVTEYEGKFPMWDEDNNPLTWYVIATDTTNNVKTVKSFVSTDPAYTNHGGGYFRFIKEADFKVEGYPVPTKENVVSMNMPNDMGITAFSNYSAVNFQAGVDYTPDKLEILFLRCPNTLTDTTRLVQATKALEVEFDKNSTFTELSHLSFHNCKSLRKVNIPASVVTICSSGSDGNGRAFFNCGYLEQLTFDEGSNLKEIQGGAFKGAKIKEIQLPASMVTINNNALSYTSGLEIVRLPETFTHFVNLNSNGSIRNDHQSFTYSSATIKEYYLPVTFYATKPETAYRVSYAFNGGGNVKFFYCGTLEQFNIARENFRGEGTTAYTDGNDNFLKATTVSYEDYLTAIALDPNAYSDADYVIYNYNSCDAFRKGAHDCDTDCTTADACQNGCGLTNTKNESHNNGETLTFANGITADGVYCVGCKNDGCSVKTEETVKPVFVAKGYSTNTDKNAINGGYEVNPTSLALYERLIGTLEYGIIIANANSFGEKTFLDENNKVNSDKALQVEMDKQYASFDCSINFGTKTGMDLDLVICAYVIEGDTVTYIQSSTGDDVTISGESFKSVTLAQVVALQPTTSKED
ncbi:MAG: leucine-rich repeat domain-containing protein [Clostridia bacterium]|nr:leucine-rich repeat domain-containing protein [Clostridia bacterium]